MQTGRNPYNVNSKLLELLDKEFGNVQGEMEDIPHKAAAGLLMYAIVGVRADLVLW